MKTHSQTCLLLSGAAIVLLSGSQLAKVMAAQSPLPSPSSARVGADQAASVAAGRSAFVSNCGFCHGSDARGGAEGGPDLTRSQIATGGTEEFLNFLKVGRPPRMPAFDLPQAQVAEIGDFVKSQRPVAGGRDAGDPKAILVGNAEAGKVYFNGAGKCVTCHSVTGDLKGIGAKYDPRTLQGRMVLARASGGYPGLRFPGQPALVDAPRTAVVTQATGGSARGVIVKVSDYLITLKETDGSLRTFTRDGDVPKVVITDPLQAHIDMLSKWTSQNLHDTTAYLVTLK